MLSQGLKNSLNKIRQISSDIYHQYIPILEDDTDIGTFAQPILTVPEVYNEFCNALVNRIVYTNLKTPPAVRQGVFVVCGYKFKYRRNGSEGLESTTSGL